MTGGRVYWPCFLVCSIVLVHHKYPALPKATFIIIFSISVNIYIFVNIIYFQLVHLACFFTFSVSYDFLWFVMISTADLNDCQTVVSNRQITVNLIINAFLPESALTFKFTAILLWSGILHLVMVSYETVLFLFPIFFTTARESTFFRFAFEPGSNCCPLSHECVRSDCVSVRLIFLTFSPMVALQTNL